MNNAQSGSSSQGSAQPPFDESIYFSVVSLSFLIPFVVSTIGMWKLTAIEPNTSDDPPQRSQIRWLWLAMACLTVVIMPINTLVLNPFEDQLLTALLGIPTNLVLIALMYVWFGYLAILSKRLPSIGLSKQCNIIKWGLAAAFAWVFLQGLVQVVILNTNSASSGAVAAQMVLGLISCVGGLAMIVFGIWSLVLTIILTIKFYTAKTDAERLGSAATASAAQ